MVGQLYGFAALEEHTFLSLTDVAPGTWLAGALPPYARRNVWFALEEHTLLLLTDAAGRHVAGKRAHPKRGAMSSFVFYTFLLLTDVASRLAALRAPPKRGEMCGFVMGNDTLLLGKIWMWGLGTYLNCKFE